MKENRDRALHLSLRCDVEELRRLLDLPKMRSAKADRALAAVVTDAILSAKVDPNRRISYSRRNERWQQARRYHGPDISYKTVVPTIDVLLDAGILVDHDRQPGGYASGIQSSYRPAPFLSDIELPSVVQDVWETVRLKDANGHLVSYRENERTRRDRSFLAKLNRVYAETEIDVAGSVIDEKGNPTAFNKQRIHLAQKALYRVFNGDWLHGGRLYGGWWQFCRSEFRPFITIDGAATVEPDYSQLHPRLLYALSETEIDGDAYNVQGWPRSKTKLAFQVLLNSSDLQTAIRALEKNLDLDEDEAVCLIGDLKAKHPNIRKHFHTGVGLKLQYVDSEMCMRVLETLLEMDVVALPVHDSFIVSTEHEGLVQAVMSNAFDFGCKLSKRLFKT